MSFWRMYAWLERMDDGDGGPMDTGSERQPLSSVLRETPAPYGKTWDEAEHAPF